MHKWKLQSAFLIRCTTSVGFPAPSCQMGIRVPWFGKLSKGDRARLSPGTWVGDPYSVKHRACTASSSPALGPGQVTEGSLELWAFFRQMCWEAAESSDKVENHWKPIGIWLWAGDPSGSTFVLQTNVCHGKNGRHFGFRQTVFKFWTYHKPNELSQDIWLRTHFSHLENGYNGKCFAGIEGLMYRVHAIGQGFYILATITFTWTQTVFPWFLRSF